ncbi:MAG: biopolymer transporter ExbD [Proteobacteria bacterium]|nr:biopolymer transporter ExbD [Candidatus Fonsibacter sp. PEL5]
MNFQRGKKHEDLELNLVPLIDVLLVIIIFLVVSTTFSRFSELKINLPTAEANSPDKKPNVINVSITADGVYSVNETQLPSKNLESIIAALKNSSKGEKEVTVIINADAKCEHQSVINVMEASRQAGLIHITFSTKIN